MSFRKVSQAETDRVLRVLLDLALEGDIFAAKWLHAVLSWCVANKVNRGRKWAMTPNSQLILAKMHADLSTVDRLPTNDEITRFGSGGVDFKRRVENQIPQAVLMKRRSGQPHQLSYFVRDLLLVIEVKQVVLKNLKITGKENISGACRELSAKRDSQSELAWQTIRKIYYQTTRNKHMLEILNILDVAIPETRL